MNINFTINTCINKTIHISFITCFKWTQVIALTLWYLRSSKVSNLWTALIKYLVWYSTYSWANTSGLRDRPVSFMDRRGPNSANDFLCCNKNNAMHKLYCIISNYWIKFWYTVFPQIQAWAITSFGGGFNSRKCRTLYTINNEKQYQLKIDNTLFDV